MLIHSYHIDGKSAVQLDPGRLWVRACLAVLCLRAKRFWAEILTELGQTRDPVVWQTRDRTRQQSWCVYDPITGKTLENLSESEVRIWLEKRYL